MKNQVYAFIFLLLFSSSIVLSSAAKPPTASSGNSVPAVIAFGDSTLDPGNNDGNTLLLRADHPPYGMDFPGQVPTGRFSDGKLITDFLVSALGLKDTLPAYLDPKVTDHDLVTGVSFASAGSGLDDLTASNANVMNIGKQVQYFEEYLRRLQRVVGGEAAANQTINDSIIVIGAGSNDMMMNYYMPIFPQRRNSMSISAYQDFLLQRLESLLQKLYSMGGRKFTISGLPPIGCLPFQINSGSSGMPPIDQNGEDLMSYVLKLQSFFSNLPAPPIGPQRGCVNKQNNDAIAYNTKLHSLISKLQASLSGTMIVYIDIYNPLLDMIKNPNKYGFVETSRGCCGTGVFEMGPLCNIITPKCSDATKYLFFDAVHPSQAAYQALAESLVTSLLPVLTN